MINTKNTAMGIDEAISNAIRAEEKVRDILLTRTATELNPDFTVSSLPRNPAKAGLQLMDPALKQLVRTVTDMPSKALDWFRMNNLGVEASTCYNKLAKVGSDEKLKFRLYTPEEHKTTCFAVVTERYQEFPKSQILEALKDGTREWFTGSDLTVGIPNLKNNGKFGRTVIHPWELNACIPMETFTGPRGDKYVTGIHIKERGDGTAGCILEAFLFRVLCENGMVEEKWASQVNISHRGKNAWGKLQREIRNGVANVVRNLSKFQESIGMLPSISLENPFAALVAVAEKDLGERRVMQARTILDQYIREMGNNADAVVNTITHIGAHDKVDSSAELAQALGGRVLRLKPEQWVNAEARGMDILAQRVSNN